MLATALLASFGLVSAATISSTNPFAWGTGCPTSSKIPYSCHNTTVQSNTCCFESPGGLLMQVQLWDTTGQTGQHDQWVSWAFVKGFSFEGVLIAGYRVRRFTVSGLTTAMELGVNSAMRLGNIRTSLKSSSTTMRRICWTS